MTAEGSFSQDIRRVSYVLGGFAVVTAVFAALDYTPWKLSAGLATAAGIGYGLSHAVHWLGTHIDPKALLQAAR